MAETFGKFESEPLHAQEYLFLQFSPSSISLRQRWRNNGVSADFVASYLMTFFPGVDDPQKRQQHNRIKAAVTYIANELLENAMKYTDTESALPIKMELYLYQDYLVFLVNNAVSRGQSVQWREFAGQLHDKDPQEFYLEQMEKNAEDDAQSRLGILTMINDYEVQLGWKLEAHPEFKQQQILSTRVSYRF